MWSVIKGSLLNIHVLLNKQRFKTINPAVLKSV